MFISKVWPAVMELDVVDLANEISSSVMVVVRNILLRYKQNLVQ